jgi:UDP-glucose 4-epimerase
MKCLIIGGNGFIGSHLADKLLREGNFVRIFDVSYERFRDPLDKVDYRIGLLHNKQDLYEAMLGIDIVYHLASASVPSTSGVDVTNDIEKNLVTTISILDLLVSLKIRKFVYFSSGGAVYGNPETRLISESHPCRPISSYGIIKNTIENYLLLYERLHGLNILILRPSNPYGPRQGHFIAQGVISTFLRNIKSNSELCIYGDGSSQKDYIYIVDLVEICYNISKSNYSGIYNIGSGNGTSINEIIKIIEKITLLKPKCVFLEKKEYDVSNFVLDISKVLMHQNSKPNVSLDSGIALTWDWIIKNNIY